LLLVLFLSFTYSIIYVQDYESDEKFTIPDERISHLLPASCQDMIVRVYSKKPELVSKIKSNPILIFLFTHSSQHHWPCTLNNPIGGKNFRGVWKLSAKNIWNQSTDTFNTREEETPYMKTVSFGILYNHHITATTTFLAFFFSLL